MNNAEHNVYTSHSICYLDEVHTRWTAFKLLHIGYKYFIKAYRICNFEGIKHTIREIEEKGMLNVPADNTFADEILLDSIKISICFENYLKAQLLLQGFLIHLVQPIPGDLRQLQRRQQTSPVAIAEVTRSRRYIYDSTLRMNTLPGISEKTLNYSTLLDRQGYLNTTGLPSNILPMLRRFNNTRNTLHFLGATSDQYDQTFILNTQTLIDFADANIKMKSNQLAAELNLTHLIFP